MQRAGVGRGTQWGVGGDGRAGGGRPGKIYPFATVPESWRSGALLGYWRNEYVKTKSITITEQQLHIVKQTAKKTYLTTTAIRNTSGEPT